MGESLTNQRPGRFSRFSIGIICLVLSLVFAYLAFFSALFTYVIEAPDIMAEHMLRQRDVLWQNLLVAAALLLLLCIVLRYESRLSLPWCTGLSLGLIALLGVIWVLLSTGEPRADSATCFTSAKALLFGEAFPTDYYQRLPHQVGFTLFCEIFVSLLGDAYQSMQLLNVLYLLLAYAALLTLSWRTFQNRRIQLGILLLLLLCPQPILYCTFVYGNLPGLALMLWAFVLGQSWAKGASVWHFFGSALCCALAIFIKPNYWIGTLALILVLFLYLLSNRRFRALPLLLLPALMALLVTGMGRTLFTAQSGIELSQGTPQTAWLAMGMQEGSRAPGWYNQYPWYLLEETGFDHAAASQKAQADILARLNEFSSHPAYAASFYHQKLISQWTETTYESLWIQQVQHLKTEPRPLVESISQGAAAPYIRLYMDGYAIVLLGSFALGLAGFAWKLKKNALAWYPVLGRSLLLVMFLGGFLYHMLFEAKSQYLMIYLPLMVPFASAALISLIEHTRALASRVRLFKARS